MMRSRWAALEPAAAPEPVWLDQACVRHAGGPGRCWRGGGAAAAMGRAEVLQRVRAERVSQGQDDLGREDQVGRGGGSGTGPAVQVGSGRAGGWGTGARLHLGGRRGRCDAVADGNALGQRAVQPGDRAGADVSGFGTCGVGCGGKASVGGIRRYAGESAGQIQIVHRGADGPAAGGGLHGSVHDAGRGIRRYVQDHLAGPDLYV